MADIAQTYQLSGVSSVCVVTYELYDEGDSVRIKAKVVNQLGGSSWIGTGYEVRLKLTVGTTSTEVIAKDTQTSWSQPNHYTTYLEVTVPKTESPVRNAQIRQWYTGSSNWQFDSGMQSDGVSGLPILSGMGWIGDANGVPRRGQLWGADANGVPRKAKAVYVGDANGVPRKAK
ncbi:MAG: hypothetical protein GX900_06555 [Clostridiaceae bacterium]|jgi:hypothetical protein|nr:hypothetical protein [Clostridiaceae bacterium]